MQSDQKNENSNVDCLIIYMFTGLEKLEKLDITKSC